MFSVTPETRSAYYKYLARLNFEAADAADRKVGFWPGYERAAPPPVMTLCAHSIELALKSYLLDKGLSEGEVKALGHDLLACWEKCVVLGADASLIDREILELISDLLKSNRLRYGEKAKLGRVPVYGPLSEVCHACLDLCGAPSVSSILKAGAQ